MLKPLGLGEAEKKLFLLGWCVLCPSCRVTQQALPWSQQDKAGPGGMAGIDPAAPWAAGEGSWVGPCPHSPADPPFPKFTSHFVLALRGGRDNGY